MLNCIKEGPKLSRVINIIQLLSFPSEESEDVAAYEELASLWVTRELCVYID